MKPLPTKAVMTPLDLFADASTEQCVAMGASAFVLRQFALPYVDDLLTAISHVETASPFRHMVTPGGFEMSVALTNCGNWGWVTDRRGYRYTHIDPESQRPWPAMPAIFSQLAREAALTAGFGDFEPDACLINRYLPGSRLSLHQDKNERDFTAPVVSVSLGMTATFLFGGHQRGDKTVKVPLQHGDVAVWGREDRLRFHGILPLKEVPHAVLGGQRINFTFRKAA